MLDDFVSAENITSSVDKRLAVLLGHKTGKLILVLLQELLILQHVAHSLRDWHIPPRLKGILGVRNSRIELLLRGEGHLGDDILREGALHIEALSRLGLNPRAVDVVLVLFQ